MPKDKKQDVNINIGNDDDEGLTVEEALAKISMLLAETKNPKVLTEIDEREIKLAAALYPVAELMTDDLIKDFLHNFLLLRVSHHRKGRGELLDIAKSVRQEPEQRIGRLKSFFQGLR